MFLNWYVHSLDNKNRLTIPAKFRGPLAMGVVVAPHPHDRCLMLFPQAKWIEVMEKLDQAALFESAAATLRRLLIGGAEDLELDAQGRIVLSQYLREQAEIQSDVRVAGAYTFLELWNPTLWEERVEKPRRNGEVKPDMFASLKI